MMVPQCWKNNEDSFYKMQKTCESAMTYWDAIGDPEDLFEYCLCYKNIILQTTFCDQPTCLSRELRASLLQLKMRHADMKRTQNLSSIFSPVRFLALTVTIRDYPTPHHTSWQKIAKCYSLWNKSRFGKDSRSKMFLIHTVSHHDAF